MKCFLRLLSLVHQSQNSELRSEFVREMWSHYREKWKRRKRPDPRPAPTDSRPPHATNHTMAWCITIVSEQLCRPRFSSRLSSLLFYYPVKCIKHMRSPRVVVHWLLFCARARARQIRFPKARSRHFAADQIHTHFNNCLQGNSVACPSTATTKSWTSHFSLNN